MSKSSLIAVLALVASVMADPLVYEIPAPVLPASSAYTAATYNTLGVPRAYPGGYSGFLPPYPLSALSSYESSFGLPELAPLVSPGPASQLIYSPTYPYGAAAAGYVFRR